MKEALEEEFLVLQLVHARFFFLSVMACSYAAGHGGGEEDRLDPEHRADAGPEARHPTAADEVPDAEGGRRRRQLNTLRRPPTIRARPNLTCGVLVGKRRGSVQPGSQRLLASGSPQARLPHKFL